MKDIKNSILILESWLYDKGFDIEYETDAADALYRDGKVVIINSRKHAEKRLYVLLHECGHVLINNAKDRVYALSRETETVMGKRVSRKRRVAVITEELEAWKRGEKLARRLGIEINEEKFDKIKADAIISYVEWARD
jgi:hypothetical protein